MVDRRMKTYKMIRFTQTYNEYGQKTLQTECDGYVKMHIALNQYNIVNDATYLSSTFTGLVRYKKLKIDTVLEDVTDGTRYKVLWINKFGKTFYQVGLDEYKD